MFARSWMDRRDEQKYRGFLGQENYSVRYCNGGYTSLYVYPNPQNVHHQE